MLRVYFDSNIFRALKVGRQYNKDLFETVNNLKNKLLFIFSDAHLDDIRNSSEEHRNNDLVLMEDYVKDNYFYYDPIKKQFQCLLATPQEAFDGKDYQAYNNALANPFDFENLFNDLEGFPEGKILKSIFDLYLSIPISLISNTHDLSELDEKHQQFINKIIPNYNPLMSLKELMKNMSPFTSSLLQDEKQFTELRKYVAEYMDRDLYSFEKWGANFNEKLKETSIGRSFTDLIDSMLTDKQENDFQLKFTYAYTLLEIYNITQERNSKGIKKFNMSSLNTDASHTYFGSFCDYIVSNDKGLQVKANIVYQMFGFKTKVLSPKDFVNLGHLLLGQEETFSTFSSSFEYDLENGFLLKENKSIESGIQTLEFKTGHYYFNYFNRIQIITENGLTIYAFYCDRESHGNFFMYREIEILVRKMNLVFGVDDELRGEYDFKENAKWETGETIRKWTISNLCFSLTTSNKSFGNFIVFMIQMNLKGQPKW